MHEIDEDIYRRSIADTQPMKPVVAVDYKRLAMSEQSKKAMWNRIVARLELIARKADR